MAQIDRRRFRLVKGRSNRAEAERKLLELLQLRDANPTPDGALQTVASVTELYLTHARRSYPGRTLYERRHILQDFAEAHGWRKVNDRDCKPFHLTSWIDAHPTWRSDWTINQSVNVVQRPFNWAARERLIPVNPFRVVTHRAGEPRRPMTDDEFERLLAACVGRQTKAAPTPADRFREIVAFLRLTGARPDEACGVRWADVDLDGRVIVLRQHKTARTQRSPRPRVIVLPEDTVELLRQIRERGEPVDHVFLTFRRTPWHRSTPGQRVKRARAKAGIPDDAKLYGLRHAFGTRAVVNRVDLKALSVLMGHSTTRMTEHYLHLAGQREHLADAMRRVNAPRRAP